MNYFIAKRLFDYALSIIGFLFFLPFTGLIAFLIFIDDGRPIFYVKKTVGIYGRVFKIFKFRSMKKDSLHIIKVGRLLRQRAMDELPQLLAIAKGEMSFVGPRPYGIEKYGISKDFTEKRIPIDILSSDRALFAQRLRMRPGLTGLAQIYAPKRASDEEVLKWDLKYIKERNFLLDLYIILASFYVTIGKGWERLDRKL